MNFYEAITNSTLTENGMPTNVSSLSRVVDMFFYMGSCRNKDTNFLETLVSNAYRESPVYTIRAMFYNRDVRGGQGERRSFRVFFSWLIRQNPSVALKVLPLVPEYGRWDDVFVTYNTELWPETVKMIKNALLTGNGLCAKWMPREGKKNKEIYKALIRDLRWSPKYYRQIVSRYSKVVETEMCSKKWEVISYEAVPSVALKKYRKAFIKHDNLRFSNWNKKVVSGESKAHADAIFPSDIIKSFIYGLGVRRATQDEILAADAQWKSLPDYMPKNRKVLPICDTSGSMSGEPFINCVALGIYLAERNSGPFKDVFMTFSNNPTLHKLVGKTIFDKIANLDTKGWDMNTNLEAVFDLILNKALEVRLDKSEMPSTVLIMSDMQFDSATKYPSDNAISMIRRRYLSAGYEVPSIVFWNLRSASGIPAKFNENGVALVSGYSPSIVKSVMNISTPVETVLNVLNSERYAKII